MGGRFNRPDVSALYFALDADTALQEYFGTDPVRPAVVIPVEFHAVNMFDLCKPVGRLGADFKAWDCDWKFAKEQHEAGLVSADCESWRIGDQVRDWKMSGIIFPSTKRPKGVNLCLFNEHAIIGSCGYKPLDPHGEILKANPPVKVK